MASSPPSTQHQFNICDLLSLNNLSLGISLQAGWDNLAAAQRAFAYQIDKALAQPRDVSVPQ
jgi:hypothetical protein